MSTKIERKKIYCTRRWRRLRIAKLLEVADQCEGCSRVSDNLQIHHKTPVDINKPSTWFPSLEKLEALCPECHRARHEKECARTKERKAWKSLIDNILQRGSKNVEITTT